MSTFVTVRYRAESLKGKASAEKRELPGGGKTRKHGLSAGRAFGFAAGVRPDSLPALISSDSGSVQGVLPSNPEGGAAVRRCRGRGASFTPRRAFRFLSPPGERRARDADRLRDSASRPGKNTRGEAPSLPASGREKRRLFEAQAASGAGCVRPQARRRRANRSPAPSECCSRRAGP